MTKLQFSVDFPALNHTHIHSFFLTLNQLPFHTPYVLSIIEAVLKYCCCRQFPTFMYWHHQFYLQSFSITSVLHASQIVLYRNFVPYFWQHRSTCFSVLAVVFTASIFSVFPSPSPTTRHCLILLFHNLLPSPHKSMKCCFNFPPYRRFSKASIKHCPLPSLSVRQPRH